MLAEVALAGTVTVAATDAALGPEENATTAGKCRCGEHYGFP